MKNKYLKKSSDRFLVLLVSTTLLFSCSTEPDDLRAPIQDDTSIDLIVTKNNIQADNATFGEIAAISKFRPKANDIIVFSADNGVFSNNSSTYSVNVSSNDTTRAFLKYSKPDLVRVTAAIFNKYSKDVFVNFTTSYPSQILLAPDSSSIFASFDAKTSITSKLLRKNGSVSEGLFVTYYDSIATPNGGSIGTFYNNTFSNAQGISNVEYRLQDTSYHGFVFIKSFIDTYKGKVFGTNKIYIK